MSRQTSISGSRTILSRPGLWFQRVPREVRWLAVICVVALLLRLAPLNGMSTEYDEGVYWQSLRAMANGQPLFTGVFSSQPPVFLVSLYPLYMLFGQTLVAARLAIALFSLVGVVAAYWGCRELGGTWAGLLAALLLAVDPLFLTESHTLQAEAPAISLEILAVALAIASMRAGPRRRVVLSALAGATLGLGVMTKLFDVVAVLPVFAYLAQPLVASVSRPAVATANRPDAGAGWRASGVAWLVCLGGAVLVGLLVALPFVANWSVAYDQVIRFHTVAARVSGGSLLGNLKAIAHVRSEYLLWLAGVAGCALAVWRRAWEFAPIVLWLLASVAVLAQQQPLFLHHMVLLAPPLVILASHCVSALPEADKRFAVVGDGATHWAGRLALLIVLVCVVSGVVIGAKSDAQSARAPSHSTLQLAAALRDVTLPSDYVVTDDQYVAGLADRNVLPQLVDTSLVRIQSGYLTASQLEALITSTDTRTILFASGRFDQIPGFRGWVEAHFSAVPQVGNGQMLYVKAPQGPSPV